MSKFKTNQHSQQAVKLKGKMFFRNASFHVNIRKFRLKWNFEYVNYYNELSVKIINYALRPLLH